MKGFVRDSVHFKRYYWLFIKLRGINETSHRKL